MVERFPAWKDDQSYPYLALVSYNGYNYRYLNKNAPSTVGVKPNVETFTLNIDGETRDVRSWMVADYLEYAVQYDLNTDLQAVRGIYGDPSLSTTTLKRPVFRFNAAPNNMIPVNQGWSYDPENPPSPLPQFEIGLPIENSAVDIIRSNKYYEKDFGFSVRYTTQTQPVCSYVLLEGIGDAQDGISNSRWIGITPGWEVSPNTFSPSVTLWAQPGRHSERLYDNYTVNQMFITLHLGLMSTFNVKYLFKYKVKFFDPLPGYSGELVIDEEREISTGQFRDGFMNPQGGQPYVKDYNPASYGYKQGVITVYSIEQKTDTMEL